MNKASNKKISKFIDPKQVMLKYRLNHSNLEALLNDLKFGIIEQFDQFRIKLLSSLDNINYIRYNKFNPQDDIRFIFRQSVNSGLSEEQLDQKEIILGKMKNFDHITTDIAGIADNCYDEIANFMKQKQHKMFNFKEICPTGSSFLEINKQLLKPLLPLWKQPGEVRQLKSINTIFKQISPVFSKEIMKKLGSVLAQTDKKITSAQLLFRASQHNFSSEIFKEMCGGHSPTLLLAKSHHGKIFGGYTPCKWINTKEKQYTKDSTSSSFLFSLDNNQVFPIKFNQTDYAISAYGEWGPIFGSPYGPDLSISNKAHLNDHSSSSLGSHYQIPAHLKEFSQQTYSLLAGSKRFKVIQYEIYEVKIS